ncbi:MAG: hypothetical protein ACXWDN_01230 [Limisphaerales bacterium]
MADITIPKEILQQTAIVPNATEQFLAAIEKRTEDTVHLRLLKVCRQVNPSNALEHELVKIIKEIIDED